jgi:hypothetical protein
LIVLSEWGYRGEELIGPLHPANLFEWFPDRPYVSSSNYFEVLESGLTRYDW